MLDLKGLPGTNALAYFENSYFTAVKGFITVTPGGISHVNLDWSSLKCLMKRQVDEKAKTIFSCFEAQITFWRSSFCENG